MSTLGNFIGLIFILNQLFDPIVFSFILVLFLKAFNDARKRTIYLIVSSAFFSFILAFIYNYVDPGIVNQPYQYLFPIIGTSLLSLLFLKLEDNENISNSTNTNNNSDTTIIEDINNAPNSDIIINKFSITPSNFQLDSTELLQQYCLQRNLIFQNNIIICPDGAILNLQFQRLAKSINIEINFWMYHYYSPILIHSQSEDYTNHDYETIINKISQFNDSIIEFSPRLYNLVFYSNKYYDYICTKYLEHLFNKNDNDSSLNFKDQLIKSALINFIKQPTLIKNLHLTNWLCIKSHHHITNSFKSLSQNTFNDFLDSKWQSFSNLVSSKLEYSLNQLNRLRSETRFSIQQVEVMHLIDLPPLHLLVPIDQHFIDRDIDELKTNNSSNLNLNTHINNIDGESTNNSMIE